MSEEKKQNEQQGGPVKDQPAAGSESALLEAGSSVKEQADIPDKVGAATPEQQEKAAEAQAAPPAKQTTSEPSDAPAAEVKAQPTDADKEAKAKAAAEARAARASARAQKTAEPAENAAPKEPSPKQPLLDKAVQFLKEQVGEAAIVEAFINERDDHMPYMVVHPSQWYAVAELLKSSDEFDLNYLRNVSGNDMETHLEAVYHLISLNSKKEFCIKVKTDRDAPSIPSVTPIWATANWNEREIYDLLGVDFPGHPDLRRIMMPDDWVGYPLRKDYEAIDPEV